MEYVVENVKYSFSYKKLKESYLHICSLNKEAFIAQIKEVLHLACIIMWIKERGQEAISDEGIIHGLVHVLDGTFKEDYQIEYLINQFKTTCELV